MEGANRVERADQRESRAEHRETRTHTERGIIYIEQIYRETRAQRERDYIAI